MNLCVIPPLNYLELANLGDADFILAQHVLEYEDYAKFYKESKRWKIMDNGAFEQDTLSMPELLEAGRRVKADVIVLPDIPGDPDKSYWLSLYSLDELPEIDRKEFMWMVVPHGRTVDEYLYYARKWLHELDRWQVMGLSILDLYKWSTRLRPFVVPKILELQRQYNFGIHLLGLDEPLELYLYSKYRFTGHLDSVDTSLPITWAYYDDDLQVLYEKVDLPRVPFDVTLTDEQYQLAIQNIKTLKSLANKV